VSSRTAVQSIVRATSVVIEASSAPPAAIGCAFRDRCGYALPVCATVVPPLEEVTPRRWAACHRARELLS
jgi:hypothetical protein